MENYTVELTKRQLELIKVWLDCETFYEFKSKTGASPSEIFKLAVPFEKAIKS